MHTLLGSLRYGLTNLLIVAFVAALTHGGWLIWAVLVLAMLIGGVLGDAAGDDDVVRDDGSSGGKGWSLADVNLYATVPLLMIMTVLLLGLIATHADSRGEGGATALIGAVLGTGYFYALAGVTVAHELIHRLDNPLAPASGRILLAFTLNPTFESYHVLGHHRNVCLMDDPATARRGEYVLAFVVRTVIFQSVEGWRLEAERLRRRGLAVWSLHNRVLAGAGCSFCLLAAAALIAGPGGSLAVLAAAIVGRVLHEMVNYVQHYGIVRAEGAPIETRHAWDCERLVSNAMFYNLPRHADHHQFAGKPFWALETPAESPKLPHGYQTMSVIALIPSWWRRTIDPLLADWDRRLADDCERSLVRERGWTIDLPPQAERLDVLDRNAGT